MFLEANVRGRLYLGIKPAKYTRNLLDLYGDDTFTGFDMSPSHLDVKQGESNRVVVSASLGLKSHFSFTPKVCFLLACLGVKFEYDHQMETGADIGMTVTLGDESACGDEWELHSKWTPYVEYNAAQKQRVSDKMQAAAGNVVVAGGGWFYATYPWFKIYAVFDIPFKGMLGIGCRINEKTYLYNTHDSQKYTCDTCDTQAWKGEPAHEFAATDDDGKPYYLYRTADSFAYQLTDEDVIAIPCKEEADGSPFNASRFCLTGNTCESAPSQCDCTKDPAFPLCAS